MIGINVFGFSGNLFGEKDLKIIKTKWLDIIYPESCEDSATILYANGDRIFQEVTKQYGLEPDFRLPVVITPTIDLYNAFYTPAPYNRIVLFDTSTQTLDDLSSSFSENLLLTFRHELTHAVTYNMKNGFWKGFSKVFGDVIVPGYFFVTSGMAEGAAVASESAAGEGRLNNEYSKHFVKQSIIENKFPNYYDVQGTGDNMIPGIQYYFNGPFHQWLQQKYGMEKYADFWHKVINLNKLGVNLSFKKVYGQSIRKTWKEFKNSYEIPHNIKESRGKLNINGDEGERYSSFSKTEKGIYFINNYSSEFYFISNDKLTENKINPEIIFSHKGLDNVSISDDGRVVGLSYFSNNKPAITSKVKLYDSKKNQFFKIEEDGLKNGKIIIYNNDYFLICHQYNSPYNTLLIYKIHFSQKDEIEKVEKIYSENQLLNTFICDFTDLGNGDFCFIKKSEKKISICIYDLSGEQKKQFDLPTGISIRQLSENKGFIYFSWASKGTMPRLGILEISNGKLLLSNEDFSGGVFNPIVINCQDSTKLIYSGIFYKGDSIYCIEKNDDSFLTFAESTLSNLQEEKSSKDLTENLKNISFISEEFEKSVEEYKWYKNLHKGMIIPFSLYTSNEVGNNLGTSSISSQLPFGCTYVTSNPWSNGSDDLLILTSGWGYLTNSFGVEALLQQGTATDLFSYSLDLKTEFDSNGWKQSGLDFSIGSGFVFGKESVFSIENNLKITGGKQNNLQNNVTYGKLFKFWDPEVFQSFAPVDDTIVFNLYSSLNVFYSNIGKKGPGRFQFGGVKVGTGIGYMYDSEIGWGLALLGDFSAMIPGILPVPMKYGLVYNLPVKFHTSIFPSNSAYGFTGVTVKQAGVAVLDTNIETVLFGIDIQKAIPYVDFIFLQDFYITAGYYSTIASYKGTVKGFQFPHVIDYFKNLGNGYSVYLDSIYVRGNLELSANIGALANPSLKGSIYCQFSLPINYLELNSSNNFFPGYISLGFQGIF